MKQIKVSDADGRVLDWLVARCEGAQGIRYDGEYWKVHFDGAEDYLGNLDFSTDWNMAGPIIEQERIGLTPITVMVGDDAGKREWFANYEGETRRFHEGDTPLIAAMRCYVISKLGETVEVPEGLT